VREQLECMELCLDYGPTESLWARIKEKTNMGDIVVGVSYMLPNQ